MHTIRPLESFLEHKYFNSVAEGAMICSVPKLKDHIIQTLNNLDQQSIDYNQLCNAAYDGLFYESNSLRSIAWRIFLGYIGLNNVTWEEEIDNSRRKYEELKNQYMLPLQNTGIKKTKKKVLDHPLSTKNDSKWNEHFKDISTSNAILKDLNRTRNEMSFFKLPNNVNPKETNLDVLKRILLLYAKLHPEVSYVQGLNEILAPIYYCFGNDSNTYFSMGAEADTFFCFEKLMEEIKNMYIKSLDESDVGIDSILNKLRDMIRCLDNELYLRLEELKINYHFFAFQWTTLMFTQQFLMPDVLSLWDIILCNKEKIKIVNEISTTILTCVRNKIVYRDFSTVMNVLQNIESETTFERIRYKLEDMKEKFETYYEMKRKK